MVPAICSAVRGVSAFFSRSASSCSVKNSFPASSAGRSSGVMVTFDQYPSRSGWPSGVCCSVQVLVLVATWPGAATAANSANATKLRNTLLGRLFSKMSIDHLLGELDALELEQLRILLDVAIERHAHLPGSSKNLRILDGRLVKQSIRTACGVAFDHVQRITVEISCPVEPGVFVEAGHVHYQRLAFPTGHRPSHPTWRGALACIVQGDVTNRVTELIGDHDGLPALDNLKRRGKVSGARYARKIALDLRVRCQPVREIFLLLRQRPRLIGDLAALHDALSGWDGSGRAERHNRASRRRMILNIPVGGVER